MLPTRASKSLQATPSKEDNKASLTSRRIIVEWCRGA
jgi:hypothetical protein